MKYCLELGLKEEPEDLDEVLSSKNFKSVEVDLPSSFSLKKVYQFGTPESYIEISYFSGFDEESRLTKLDPSLVSQLNLETPEGSDSLEMQMELGKFLRDHYGALLLDPQTNTLITE